ncbi:ribosome biogenesis regulatory protein homolog [Daphnia carinata]|uniref:ribosome biogenesis regulatory protein homolog n=1 Tax=Daphnia carinata TaxID=120202 RepID=UPI00258007BE|nr:ribosome biogenesis regulatory protein homolog [Daphnia carinata]
MMAASIVQNVLLKAAEDEAEKLKSIQVDKVVELEFDLGNLLAYDINDIDVNQLRSDKEAFLANLSRDNVQLLINQIFQLPTLKVDNEVVIKLPPGTTRLPRAKPAPKEKALSKWEKYAKEKGITKRKKSKATWDEELKKWVPRFGYKKALAEKEKNWVVEVPGNAHNGMDPIALRKTKKQESVAKNELQRLRNISARMQKSKAKSKISLEPTERPTAEQLNRSVFIAHTATASVGKFQPNLKEQKPVLKSGQKRHFDPLVGDLKKETTKSLDILDKLSNKKPKLDIEKAVNREMNQPSSDYKGKGLEKKSKTQLKKDLGKRKHKGAKDKKFSGKKGGSAGRGPAKKGGKRTGNKN